MPIDIENDSVAIALKKLKAREETFVTLERITKLGSWEVDLITQKSIWSEQSFINYGYAPGEVDPHLNIFLSHLLPQELPKAQKALQELMSTGEVATLQSKFKKDNGEIIDILLHGQAIYDENKIPIKIIGTTQDITQQVNLEKKSSELAHIIEYSSNEIYIIDYETLNFLYANKSACEALGYSMEELFQMNILNISIELTLEHINYLKEFYQKENKAVLDKSTHRRKDGSIYYVQAYMYGVTYNDIKAIVIFDTDITKTIEAQEEILRQSEQINYKENYDVLTSLPNRTLFQDRLSQAIILSQKNKQKFALLFIDLDQFKKINDSLGHETGDKVIIYIAKRLQKVLQSEDTVARIGGDEFTVILNNIANIQYISAIAKRIMETIKEPIQIDDNILHVTSSIGVSLFPNDSQDANDLKKFSDAAMYKAKDEGRNNFQFYSSEMTQLAFEKVVMENSLMVAIKEKQFLVYYQPQYNALTNTLTGMEALVRWKHPDLGIIAPIKFLPIAHESGLMLAIDQIVMQKSMQDFTQWYLEGLNPGKLSLNLTMVQLNSENFIQNILNVMQKLGFNPTWLELEILESHIMGNPEESIKKLLQINDLGIDIAIDDFGTGYSSLAYLKRLPLDKLKIDRSFIMDIPVDEDDMAITKAIIALGNSLNIKLIAEGVENKAQKEFLINNGCHNIQGYLYSQPIPAHEIKNLLQKS